MSKTTHQTAAWLTERPLVLYGAGGLGRSAARNIVQAGGTVAAFLDAGAKPGDARDGIPAFTIAEWLERNVPGDFTVLMSIFNPQVDVLPILAQLAESGFARIVTPVQYVAAFPQDSQDRMWLAPPSFYAGHEAKLAQTRALFRDDHSLSWFDGVMRMRTSGDYADLPNHSHADQYMPRDFPRWSTPLRFIDCGACNGDTLDAMRSAGYTFEAVAAFEPDPQNFAELCVRHRDLNAVFLPCGVADHICQVQFDAGLGVSSRSAESGKSTIQCVSIDEALPGFAPTLIKMDVEGSELAALQGAETTLRKHAPALALSMYHKPADIWEIPLWIAELKLGYRMYLRGHGPSAIDLVLYCVPETATAS